MTALTQRQNDTLNFIESYSAANGLSPTYGEIAKGIGVVSRGRVADIVAALEERGAIRRLHNRVRSIEVVRPDNAEFHLKAILAEIGRAGAVHRDSLCVIDAMRFLGGSA